MRNRLELPRISQPFENLVWLKIIETFENHWDLSPSLGFGYGRSRFTTTNFGTQARPGKTLRECQRYSTTHGVSAERGTVPMYLGVSRHGRKRVRARSCWVKCSLTECKNWAQTSPKMPMVSGVLDIFLCKLRWCPPCHWAQDSHIFRRSYSHSMAHNAFLKAGSLFPLFPLFHKSLRNPQKSS